MKYSFALFFISIAFTAFSQTLDVVFTNAQKIDDNRYKDFDGSPYRFMEWPLADIFDAEDKAFEQLSFNINGYSKELEIRKGDKFIELDKIGYNRIEVSSEGEKFTFVRAIDGLFTKDFVQLHYNGEKRKLVSLFVVELTEKEFNSVGKTIKIKRFDPKFRYFIIEDGKSELVKMKKKALLAFLGNKKKVESIIADQNLKFKDPTDLVKLLQVMETQGI